MYKILAALLPFIKELFFDRKEEMDFNSYRFNIKKWIAYAAFLFLLTYSITISHRLFSLNGKFIEIKRRYHKLEIVEKTDLEMIDTLKIKNSDLQVDYNELTQRCLIDAKIPRNKTTPAPKLSSNVKNSVASK